MKKRSTPKPSTTRAKGRRVRSPVPPDEAAGDAIGSTRRGAWDSDRTDIERANEGHGHSIETASRDAEAGGVEAPESLSEVKKALPFE